MPKCQIDWCIYQYFYPDKFIGSTGVVVLLIIIFS